jgi:hypothetical protein
MPCRFLRLPSNLNAWVGRAVPGPAGAGSAATNASQMPGTECRAATAHRKFNRPGKFQGGLARQASPRSFCCRTIGSDDGGGKPPHSKAGSAMIGWSGSTFALSWTSGCAQREIGVPRGALVPRCNPVGCNFCSNSAQARSAMPRSLGRRVLRPALCGRI